MVFLFRNSKNVYTYIQPRFRRYPVLLHRKYVFMYYSLRHKGIETLTADNSVLFRVYLHLWNIYVAHCAKHSCVYILAKHWWINNFVFFNLLTNILAQIIKANEIWNETYTSFKTLPILVKFQTPGTQCRAHGSAWGYDKSLRCHLRAWPGACLPLAWLPWYSRPDPRCSSVLVNKLWVTLTEYPGG